MFRLIRETHIDFMGARKVAAVFSAILILVGIGSLIGHGGPRYGIDFTGGRLLELGFTGAEVPTADVRSALAEQGITDVEVQAFEAGMGAESGVLIRFTGLELSEAAVGDVSPSVALTERLEAQHPGLSVEVLLEDSVGPKIGAELRGRAIKAILYALGAILIYVAIRYQFTFGLGAVAALFHDVFVTFGVLSLLNVEINLPIVAALLTIAGYSINDTIVVFDRIRERRKSDSRKPLKTIINMSINQVLGRTVVTSLTTLFTAGALYTLGGPVIHDFALSIVIGVIIGTYSSIFVATSLAYQLLLAREKRQHKQPKKKKAVATA